MKLIAKERTAATRKSRLSIANLPFSLTRISVLASSPPSIVHSTASGGAALLPFPSLTIPADREGRETVRTRLRKFRRAVVKASPFFAEGALREPDSALPNVHCGSMLRLKTNAHRSQDLQLHTC